AVKLLSKYGILLHNSRCLIHQKQSLGRGAKKVSAGVSVNSRLQPCDIFLPSSRAVAVAFDLGESLLLPVALD
ncbi:hypothetical protein, partial [Erwinia amylovora]|uniref:hypothetical protein n=1 Tax=Erwinia amylovora TaxID=552 RepID=UPI0020BE2B71